MRFGEVGRIRGNETLSRTSVPDYVSAWSMPARAQPFFAAIAVARTARSRAMDAASLPVSAAVAMARARSTISSTQGKVSTQNIRSSKAAWCSARDQSRAARLASIASR